jgi:hypothetical protein
MPSAFPLKPHALGRALLNADHRPAGGGKTGRPAPSFHSDSIWSTESATSQQATSSIILTQVFRLKDMPDPPSTLLSVSWAMFEALRGAGPTGTSRFGSKRGRLRANSRVTTSTTG